MTKQVVWNPYNILLFLISNERPAHSTRSWAPQQTATTVASCYKPNTHTVRDIIYDPEPFISIFLYILVQTGKDKHR